MTWVSSVKYEIPHRLPGTVYGYGPSAVAAYRDLMAEIAAMKRRSGGIALIGKPRVGLQRPE